MAMLKNITRVPISTMLAVAQHHEHCNGSGRIFHAPKERIHDFARVIAIADSYESACRFFNASVSIAFAIRSAQAGDLDIVYLKGLLSVTSLYPIGTAVLLNTGYIGKVVSNYTNEFKTPIVRTVFKMCDGHLFPIDSFDMIDLKKNSDVTIVEELNHSALKSDLSIGF